MNTSKPLFCVWPYKMEPQIYLLGHPWLNSLYSVPANNSIALKVIPSCKVLDVAGPLLSALEGLPLISQPFEVESPVADPRNKFQVFISMIGWIIHSILSNLSIILRV